MFPGELRSDSWGSKDKNVKMGRNMKEEEER